MTITKYIPTAATILLLTVACGAGGNSAGDDSATSTVNETVPAFSGDSAFRLVVEQCDMGPRVPGTPAHARCVSWLIDRLTPLADTVVDNTAPVTTYDNHHFTAHNIVAAFNSSADTRILLLAHYDCRPWADRDPDTAKRSEPVIGANDAASGTAVLLELARLMAATTPRVGVDLLFVDVEDWGDSDNDDADDTWALGTQAWVTESHAAGYHPAYAILLDMVGARGATFMKEYFSSIYAGGIVDHVWKTAREAGASCFVNAAGGAVTDDHLPLLRAGITAIDIIDTRTGGESGFFEAWHTTGDTPDKIDPATLSQVGNTLAHIIYR